jgi:hypothetical protein
MFYHITHWPAILEGAKRGLRAQEQTPAGNLLPSRAKISGDCLAYVGW